MFSIQINHQIRQTLVVIFLNKKWVGGGFTVFLGKISSFAFENLTFMQNRNEDSRSFRIKDASRQKLFWSKIFGFYLIFQACQISFKICLNHHLRAKNS